MSLHALIAVGLFVAAGIGFALMLLLDPCERPEDVAHVRELGRRLTR